VQPCASGESGASSWQGIGDGNRVRRVHPPVHNAVAKADRGLSAPEGLGADEHGYPCQCRPRYPGPSRLGWGIKNIQHTVRYTELAHDRFCSRRIHQMHTAARGAPDRFIVLGIVVRIARGVIPSSSLGPFASSSGGGREKRPSLHIHESPAQDLMAPEKLGLRYQSIGAPSAQMACSQSGAAVRLGQRGRRRRKRPEDSYNKRPAEGVVTSRTVDNGYRPSLRIF